jgi:hypothetical protein
MNGPLPFAVHATIGCPTHAELALSLAWTLRDVDAGAVDEALTRLAQTIPAPSSHSPLDELEALTGLCPSLRAPRRHPTLTVDDLMLDGALSRGIAHPLVHAIVVAEAAQRRGLAIGIVSNGSDHCLAHTHLGEPLLLDLGRGAIVDARLLPPTLTWRCAHETCGQLLDALEARWLEQGRLDRALRAAELRTALPLDDDGEHESEQRLRRVRAKLN